MHWPIHQPMRNPSHKLLRLAEAPVLLAQLRLLLNNHASSTTPAFLIALLIVWTLGNESNSPALHIWFACHMVSKLYCAADARRTLADSITAERAPALVWRQIVLNGINGVTWNAAAWIILSADAASSTGSIMVIGILAAVASAGMTQLSPVLAVYIAFLIAALGTLALKLLILGNPVYSAMAAACVIYFFLLLGQARNYYTAARASIELRFENLELIERLRAETANAEQANKAKSKFLAAASHDLRQPIQAQSLFLEVMARGELSDPQRKVLASARAASQASASMLHTLLDFSRIEAGVVEPQTRPFLLQPLLEKMESEMKPQAAAKQLAYRSCATTLAVRSDPALIELIVRNLVSNAIRYTAHGGTLIGCRRRGTDALLEVWDSGIGIEAAQQAEIFREFHQLGNPERDRNKGLGLGLAIAQGLARTLGHDLTVASRPGRGSVFRLRLPLAVIGAAVDQRPDAAPARSVSEYVLQRELRVLVVEDDAIVRAGLEALLGAWGCTVDGAESIEQALELARAKQPDLIISDYRLRAQRTGAEAIEAVRTLCGAALPALLITGDTAPERLREATDSGIPLLHKPVATALLEERILQVLEARRATA